MTLDLRRLPYAASVPPAVRRAFAEARLLHDESSVDRAVDRVAVRMTVDLQDQNPVLVSVLPGGLVFAGMLMRRIVFPLQFTYASIDADGNVGAAEEASAMLRGRAVVLLEGLGCRERLDKLQAWAEQAGAASARWAVLLAQGDKPASGIAYTALANHDLALFGSGLDYLGYGANLPGVYAAATPAGSAST